MVAKSRMKKVSALKQNMPDEGMSVQGSLMVFSWKRFSVATSLDEKMLPCSAISCLLGGYV